MYQPDAIAAYSHQGTTYLVTANEGDARDYDAFSEEARVEDLTLDPDAYPDAATLQMEQHLGRLHVTTATGDTDGDGDIDQIYAYGARSFSIWADDGTLVYDSGDDFEQITAMRFPEEFNATNDENDTFDNRSDDKGPEPEGIVLGTVGTRTYAFIGLERIGGVMVYDVTDPRAPVFLDYVTSRDFAGDAEAGTAGDLGPEGLAYIPAADSPNGQNLLVVSNEISGSIAIFAFTATATSAEATEEIPAGYALRSNYPNPFNPTTTVLLDLPEAAQVDVTVFDLMGRRVLMQPTQRLEAGTARSITIDASVLPSGVYLYRTTARSASQTWVGTGRMTLVK
jgi:hypothetical protein